MECLLRQNGALRDPCQEMNILSENGATLCGESQSESGIVVRHSDKRRPVFRPGLSIF